MYNSLGLRSKIWEPTLNIPTMFFGGAKGAIFLPKAMSQLYQDSAGTIPVTGPGQPIGLIRDLSGNGNHAVQATALNRPVLGRHPESGLRNRANGAQAVNDNTYWRSPHTSNGTTATRVGYGIEDGIPYIDLRVTGTVTTSEHTVGYLDAIIPTEANTTWTAKITARVIAGIPASGSIFGPGGIFPRVFEYAGATNVGNSVPAGSDAVNDTFDRTLTVTRVFGATATSARTTLILRAADTGTVDVTYRIKGLQFEVGSTATALQYNFSQYDVTEAEYGSVWYLRTNGINQWMSIAPFTSGSAGRTIVAAVRKMSDVLRGTVIEHRPNFSRPGGIGVFAPGTDGGASYSVNVYPNSSGSLIGVTGGYPAPSDCIVTAVAQNGSCIMRLNGAQVASGTPPGGDWVAYNGGMTIGARDGSSLFGDLMIYGLLYIDQPLTTAEYTRVERYMALISGLDL